MNGNEEWPATTRRGTRASDAERDAVAARLNAAMAEGRLDTQEHTERLDTAYAAKTLGELEPLLADLPAVGSDDPQAPLRGRARLVDAPSTSRNAFVIMAGASREGEWTLPTRFTAASIMGHVELDLREARFTAQHTTIQAHTLMGSVEVIAPDDVILRIEGVGVMGAYWQDSSPPEQAAGDLPIVTVTGVALMGAVWGGHQLREHQKPAKKRWWRRAVEE